MAPLAVLGIDAAWTARHASGVALVGREAGGWRCLGVVPSYANFFEPAAPVSGSMPEPPPLPAQAERLWSGPFHGVMTVDMPPATAPVTGRRAADTAISRAFGARGCAVHSPNPGRPGAISVAMRQGFAALRFLLVTAATTAGREDRRIGPLRRPKPFERTFAQNGRESSPRRDNRLTGVPLAFPSGAPKAFEDALNALVCAWSGIEFLEGRAAAYIDDTAAIWAPGRAQGAAA